MENTKNCEKCGKSLTMIPPKGTPGVEVTNPKTGNTYFPFWKCKDDGWSFSSNPNPKRFTRKPPTAPQSNKEIMDKLNVIEGLIVKLAESQGIKKEELPF